MGFYIDFITTASHIISLAITIIQFPLYLNSSPPQSGRTVFHFNFSQEKCGFQSEDPRLLPSYHFFFFSLLWGRGVVKCWQLFTRVSAQTKTLIACNRLSQSNRSPLNTERPCCDSPRAWLLMNGKSYFVLAPGICSSQFSGRGFASWLVKKMKKKKERLATTSITWLLCWRKPRILSLSLYIHSLLHLVWPPVAKHKPRARDFSTAS